MSIDVERTYQKYGPMVLRRCRRLLRDEGLALDAMHDVFVQLLRRDDALSTEQPGRLLMSIATHVCLNRIRSRRRHPEDGPAELLPRIAGADRGADHLLSVRSVLSRIFGREQESTRVIAVMHLVDGLTLEEVAREVNLSVSGVRKRLRTLRARVVELEGVDP